MAESVAPKDAHFIIYYLNYPKAIELCMTMGNVMQKSSSVEKTTEAADSLSAEVKGDLSTDMAVLKAAVGSKLGGTSNDSESFKVADTYEVKHTKSTYLKLIVERAEELPSCAEIQDCEPGDLVRVNNVSLWPFNWDEITQMQVLRHDALKGMRVEGVDINNIISSMLEDYAYVLTAIEELPGTGEPVCLAIKIPSENDNEFESKYRIRDLLLGKVSLVGVYKGPVDVDVLTNTTFGDLRRKGMGQRAGEEGRVIKSSLAASASEPLAEEAPSGMPDLVHYLDLIAIVQDVRVTEPINEELPEEPAADCGISREIEGEPGELAEVDDGIQPGEEVARPCFLARLKARLCG